MASKDDSSTLIRTLSRRRRLNLVHPISEWTSFGRGRSFEEQMIEGLPSVTPFLASPRDPFSAICFSLSRESELASVELFAPSFEEKPARGIRCIRYSRW